ncbi:MAG: GNAT family N-acetyltransferase, partial [Blastocatellia bacterium]
LKTEVEQVNSALYIPLPVSWDEYLKSMGSSDRYYLNRALKDFERWAGSDYEIKQVRSPHQLAEGKRVLVQLHQHRWQSDGQDGAFNSDLFTEFHDAVLPVLLESNSLQLLWLTVRGEPIAALYNILHNGKVSFYQSGRKLGLPKGIRAGTVIQAHAIKQAIADGRREYDFLAGTSQFKRKLSLASRPLVRLRTVKRSVVEYARALTESGIAQTRAARGFIKNLSTSRPSPAGLPADSKVTASPTRPFFE